jgi:hypothetical protein
MMSRTESADPNREKPNTDTLEPRRAKLLIEIAEPMCKKSSTLKDDARI